MTRFAHEEKRSGILPLYVICPLWHPISVTIFIKLMSCPTCTPGLLNVTMTLGANTLVCEMPPWPSLARLPPPEKSEVSGQLSVVDSYQRPDIGAPIRTLYVGLAVQMCVVIQLLAQARPSQCA